VTVTDDNGCVQIDSVSIGQPGEVYTTVSVNDTICIGSSGTLTATASGGVGGYEFAWAPVGIKNFGTLNISPTTNTSYRVIAYDANGCQGSIDTAMIIVRHFNDISLDAKTTITPICIGQTPNVFADITGVKPLDILTYSWDNGLGSGLGPHMVSPSVPTTYTITVTNSCGDQISSSVDIGISLPPSVSVMASETYLCDLYEIQFSDNSITGNPADPIHYWQWDFGDGNTSQLKNPTHTYDNIGIYQVTLTVTTGNECTNDNAGTPIIISVYPGVEAGFSVKSELIVIPIERLITTNTSVGANEFEWDFGDGTSSNQMSPEKDYTSVDFFDVELVAKNQFGCSDTAWMMITTDSDLLFPTAFTPNIYGSSGGVYDMGSLNNDVFHPYTSGVVEFELQIFNRWGELVFESYDINLGWDGYYKGKLAPKDVYAFKAYVKLNTGGEYKKIGNVTLIR